MSPAAPRSNRLSSRASDPRFREAWDQALERGLDALEDSLFERGAAGDTTAAIFLLKKRRPHIYGDQPKTVNQNLNVRLMSPEQREEEARQILERIAALGLPIPDEYVTVEVSDAEYEELVRGGRAL